MSGDLCVRRGRSHRLELLAPAKTAEIGIAAINHGADAVYIGGPAFGARAAAANSLGEIERLVRHARLFHARVYATVNTIFDDAELEQAVVLAHNLWNAGVDALIIQDMGLLECELPPIPLHASTQCDIRLPEKAAFLEAVGFQQLVVARELTLAEIRKLRAATTVALEFFVHGALCVSYSGQCYISEVLTGRSANRGECAQFCRHRCSLRRANGDEVAEGFLLSLQDLNLSGQLRTLVDAGISSFKIEGRLKDAGYVKNVTAAYRLELDAILEERPGCRSSSGRCHFSFTPNPAKSFHRGGTDYCIGRRDNRSAGIRTPKATGEPLGPVVEIRGNRFRLATDSVVAAGDGLCFFDRDGNLHGVRVNRVDGDWISLRQRARFGVGTVLNRNLDIAFNRLLNKSVSPRRIELSMTLRQLVREHREGLLLTLVDEDGLCSETFRPLQCVPAEQPGQAKVAALRQLSRLGSTFFTLKELTSDLYGDPFLAAAVLNELRRQAVAAHEEVRRRAHRRQTAPRANNTVPWIAETAGVLDNIRNTRAAAFYRRHGAEIVGPLDPAEATGLALMRTRYCVKYQLGLCPHKGVGLADRRLFLRDRSGERELRFDCVRCEMTVLEPAALPRR